MQPEASRWDTNDLPLWDAFDAALAAGEDHRRHAAAIVEHHLGYIRSYASRTIFPGLDLDEYVAELVAVAMRLVPRFDRSYARTSGKPAAFVPFLKPYLQEVRWVLAAAQADLGRGKETQRMIAAAQQCIAEAKALGVDEPTIEEIDAFVSKKLGKPIGVSRISRALAMPLVVRGDKSDSPGRELWEYLPDSMPTPEEHVVAALDAAEMVEAVADALAACELTDLEKDIVATRLMAAPKRIVDGHVVSPGPATLTAIAGRHGVSTTDVRHAEESVKARLRTRLADLG